VEQNLFDKKTGEPFGDSGLGNIYSHQFLLEPGIRFPTTGNYYVRLNHMMRYDTLPEIRSIGIRVEKSLK
jgi:gliding motility-associated lipoprotein GldH